MQGRSWKRGGRSFVESEEWRVESEEYQIENGEWKMNVKFDGMHNEHPTNELRGTVIPQGTLSCPSGNSPCAAPAEMKPPV